MKKIFLLVAFAGTVAASSATSFTSLFNGSAIEFLQDDKKQDDKKKCDKKKACCKGDAKHDCTKHAKGECKKDSTNCTASQQGKKACCKPKSGATPAVPPTKE